MIKYIKMKLLHYCIKGCIYHILGVVIIRKNRKKDLTEFHKSKI